LSKRRPCLRMAVAVKAVRIHLERIRPQLELLKALGVPDDTVSRWENALKEFETNLIKVMTE